MKDTKHYKCGHFVETQTITNELQQQQLAATLSIVAVFLQINAERDVAFTTTTIATNSTCQQSVRCQCWQHYYP